MKTTTLALADVQPGLPVEWGRGETTGGGCSMPGEGLREWFWGLGGSRPWPWYMLGCGDMLLIGMGMGLPIAPYCPIPGCCNSHIIHGSR